MKHACIWTAMIVLAVTAALLAEEAAGTKAVKPVPANDKHIDLVICLDTSGSMRGLIESAKQKLWAVVNELATARPRPKLRVALYHYGNNGLKPQTGWVQKLCGLTGNLDEIYGKLFPLRTNGGNEYVARVVKAATDELDWNMDKGTLRVIFVAGNEPATQDKKYKLQDVCKAAATKGIIINTIFCGAVTVGRRTGWEDAARWADGRYAAIDQDRGTVVVNTPYDKKLAELGAELNKTYVAYGRGGAVGAAMQKAMDGRARSLSPAAAAERATGKASGLYTQEKWDLVDATKDGKVKLAEVAEGELPAEMKKMSAKDRQKYLAEKAKQRADIQRQIQQLSEKRQAYVKKEMAKLGLSEKQAFDAVLRSAVRAQAEKKNFRFKK